MPQNQLLWWLQATKPALSPLVGGRVVTPVMLQGSYQDQKEFKIIAFNLML